MKAKAYWALTLLLSLSMLVAACGGAAPEPIIEDPVDGAPAEPIVEPDEAAMEPAEATPEDLDAAYTVFLEDMVAYNTIGLEGLNELLIDQPPFLLDVRNLDEVEENGYIEGAVVIPLRDLGKSVDMLPAYDTTIVSYCGSGWRCTIALTALEAMGWENVLGLKGGSFGGWVEAGYPIATGLPEPVSLNAAQPDPAMLTLFDQTLSTIPDGWGVITADSLNAELIENPDLVLIDVRKADELEEKGHIEGAIHIPLESFVADADLWPADTNAPVVIYCGSGHRSTIAMTMLWSYGYTDVRSLKGGFSGWVDAGYPVVAMMGS